MHILFTDDNYGERILFREITSRYDGQIQLSLADGFENLFLFLETTSNIPDIIFLDFEMPEKTGIDCLDKLRSSEKLKHIPVIIYSNTAARWKVNAAYQHGADFYLEKPIDMDEVAVFIDWLLCSPLRQHQTPARENFILTPFNIPQGLKA
jgi:CheY-like chemotaxis protein